MPRAHDRRGERALDPVENLRREGLLVAAAVVLDASPLPDVVPPLGVEDELPAGLTAVEDFGHVNILPS